MDLGTFTEHVPLFLFKDLLKWIDVEIGQDLQGQLCW